MADGIFSEDLRTNGVHVGVAGPVGRIRDRLVGFPDLTTSIQDMFVSGDSSPHPSGARPDRALASYPEENRSSKPRRNHHVPVDGSMLNCGGQ